MINNQSYDKINMVYRAPRIFRNYTRRHESTKDWEPLRYGNRISLGTLMFVYLLVSFAVCVTCSKKYRNSVFFETSLEHDLTLLANVRWQSVYEKKAISAFQIKTLRNNPYYYSAVKGRLARNRRSHLLRCQKTHEMNYRGNMEITFVIRL